MVLFPHNPEMDKQEILFLCTGHFANCNIFTIHWKKCNIVEFAYKDLIYKARLIKIPHLNIIVSFNFHIFFKDVQTIRINHLEKKQSSHVFSWSPAPWKGSGGKIGCTFLSLALEILLLSRVLHLKVNKN